MTPGSGSMAVNFSRIADFAPAGGPANGVTLATTSTLSGADLLTATPQRVTRWRLHRATSIARQLSAKDLGRVQRNHGRRPPPLGGR